MGTVDKLLPLLPGVKAAGRDRWQAKCPSHEDRNPSLTVRELDDGRVLLHCFAGCSPDEVLGSVGLNIRDLFPERLGEFKPVRAPFSAMDVLQVLRTEAAVIAFVASDIADNKPISQQDADRVALAAGRITKALEYIRAN